MVGEVADGNDPAHTRATGGSVDTVAELVKTFFEEHVEAKRALRTRQEYRRLFDRRILPELGHFPITKITRQDVLRLHHRLKKTPYQANRIIAVLSKMFNWAELNGYRPDNTNPCRHVERYPEIPRKRYLSEREIGDLAAVLEQAESDSEFTPFVIATIRLLLLTGLRISDVLSMEWRQIDFERRIIEVPDSKTGYVVNHLSEPALDVLSEIPKAVDNSHVIVGLKAGTHLVNIRKPWLIIRARAGLEDVRIHDLRHTFGGVAASDGHSLQIIGSLLGHKQASTTERYAHLAPGPVRAAIDSVGNKIANAMNRTDRNAGARKT